jgi:hypothetical protein
MFTPRHSSFAACLFIIVSFNGCGDPPPPSVGKAKAVDDGMKDSWMKFQVVPPTKKTAATPPTTSPPAGLAPATPTRNRSAQSGRNLKDAWMDFTPFRPPKSSPTKQRADR